MKTSKFYFRPLICLISLRIKLFPSHLKTIQIDPTLGSKVTLTELLTLNYKVIFELRHSNMPVPVRPFQDLSGKPKIVFLDPPSPDIFILQV